MLKIIHYLNIRRGGNDAAHQKGPTQMTNTTTAPTTFKIQKSQLAIVQSRIDRLNKRAAKLGMEPCSVVVLGEELIEVTIQKTGPGYSIPSTITICQLTIEFKGSAPVVAGYKLIANIQHTEAGNIVRDVAQDGTDFDAYRSDVKPVCDHCNTRRERKDTFIIRNVDTKETKQIGRNCLADYIRSSDVKAYALHVEIIGALVEAEEEFLGGGSYSAVTGTNEFLAFACASVRVHGFKPTSYGESTVSNIWRAMSSPFPPVTPEQRAAHDAQQPTENDKEKASKIVAWIDGVDCSSNEYLTNLKVALKMVCIDRTAGLVASAVKAFDRAMGIAEEKRLEKEQTLNEHLGQLKERLVLELTVVRTHHIETDYGTKAIVSMRDNDGRSVVWFGTSDRAIGAQVGNKFTGKATIKAHEEYNGIAQTVITRGTFKVA